MENIIWDLKADKVISLMKEGKRIDGRKFDEYRKITVKEGISENANGSARVKLGSTEIVAGIKMVTQLPYPDSPDEGTISVGMELLPLASPEFETGPPSQDAIELARVVDRGIRESKAIDFKGLCIREGELVWSVFIDAYVLNDDGNLFDATAIACLSALNHVRIPKLEDDKIVKGEYGAKLKLSKQPLLFTFAKIAGRIVADPCLDEEKAKEARFSCAVADENTLCAFQKGGSGALKTSEIDECIEIAFKKAKEFKKLV